MEFFFEKVDVDVPALETIDPSILLSFETTPLKTNTSPPEKSWLELMNFLKKTKWSSLLGTNPLDFQGCKPGKVGVEGEVVRSCGPLIPQVFAYQPCCHGPNQCPSQDGPGKVRGNPEKVQWKAKSG